MRQHDLSLLLIVAIGLLVSGLNQTQEAGAEMPKADQDKEANAQPYIAKYRDDKAAVFSFTFDDGIRDQLTVAVPLLEKYGWRGTFFIITKPTKDTKAQAEKGKPGAWCGISWEELKDMAKRGHEIGNHSATHARLTDVIDEQKLEDEVNGSWQTFKDKLGQAPYSYCYPFNAWNDQVQAKVMKKHHAARKNYRHYGGKGYTVENHEKWIRQAIENSEWIVGMFHGIEAGYSHFESPEQLEKTLENLKGHEKDLWIATFGEVAKYQTLREASTLKVVEQSQDMIRFELTTKADTKVHDVFLTVVIPVEGVGGAAWQSKNKDRQGEIAVKDGLLHVEARPGDEQLVLTLQHQVTPE